MANQEPLETLTAEQVRKRFQSGVYVLKEAPKLYEQQVNHRNEIILSYLTLHSTEPDALATDRRTLIELARYILRVLDPTPEDRILEALQRIESLLEQRTLREKDPRLLE